MHIDVAINQLKTLINFFKNYRETGLFSLWKEINKVYKEDF